jgi:hypothetical protein
MKNVMLLFGLFYFCFEISLCDKKDKQLVVLLCWYLLRSLSQLMWFLIVKEINDFEIGNPIKVFQDNLLH